MRESESPVYLAGQHIKIFLALFPSAVHLDTPPGSGSFAFRISRTRGFSRQSNYLELNAYFLRLLERFLQPRALHIARRHQHGQDLDSRPVHQFFQRRNHTLFFRPASNLGDSQQRTRRVTPSVNIQLMWPCGNRQISGCFHFCQSSSVCSASTNKS